MAIKHKLRHSIHTILMRSREGSFNTKGDRYGTLMLFADTIVKLGFGLRHVDGLKQKHIQAVVSHWKKEKLANGTMKNRLSAIRYLAEKINKKNIVPSNSDLEIGVRSYKPTFNRAVMNPNFSGITDKYVFVSLHLQRVFGLRREEAIKIRPHLADKDDQLMLIPSWCKGGRGRNIPILTEEQRHWLEVAKQLVGDKGNSLIPIKKSYITQRYMYDKQVRKAGLNNLHGLRHAYAQQRYKELTGWEAPINGGPTSKQLTPEQKKIDFEARMIITELLGHSRVQIVKNYLSV